MLWLASAAISCYRERMYLIATQCFPPTLGGIENYVGGLADALSQWGGGDVHVLADGVRRPEDLEKPYIVERFGGPKPMRRWWKRQAATRLLARGDCERIFVDSYKSIGVLPKRVSAPVMCLAHGMEFPLSPRPEKARRIAERLSRANSVLANSNYTADLAAPYLSGSTQLRVVTPPMTPQPEPTQAAIAEVTALFLGAAPLIVTLARLEPRKGVDQLILALPQIAAKHPKAMLAVAGGGPDLPRLEELAREKGVAQRVRFMGRVTDDVKSALFANATLFAMPARREGASVEGFGIVYLEAAWHGAPALAGRDGGAVDAIRDGETGLLCDGADAQSVADALDDMLSTPDRLRAMREAARVWARSQLWKQRISDFLHTEARST
ncbi:MAG: glycosyltransferase family 4 protein [Neomegalonema sp.]|nr:glycosyltransferase family 4 protein [Neomegalonema sp.]